MLYYILLIFALTLSFGGLVLRIHASGCSRACRSILVVIGSLVLVLSLFFLFSDYVTGNGIDQSLTYFIKDTFTGIGPVRGLLFLLLIAGVWMICIYISFLILNRWRTTFGWKVGQYTWFLLLLAALVLHPVTVSMLYHSFEEESMPGIYENRYEVERFIAHAGGRINGHTYTNSLEALEQSYEKGFRLFELDILTTSDSHFVAAHDWESWQSMTGYSGDIPPSLSVFQKTKLFGIYKPLTMDDINTWFNTHPDAVLVTDKVDLPAAFSKAFVAPGRLMMELFSMESLKEASNLQIRSAMASWELLKELDRNQILSLLDQLKIKDIALSRREIKYHIPLLKELKRRGIRAYAFHVNYDRGKDEKFVLCYDLDYVFGMYADDFDFENKVDCGE
ncbi:MAG: hypothetical protein P8100_00040 [bacterium]